MSSSDAAESTDLTVPKRAGRRRRPPRQLNHTLTSVGPTSPVANIIMQLSLPPVGVGVSESRVVSGSPRRRPIKRGRTTTTYLALAAMGTDRDRDAMRRAVAEVHTKVHSTPDSPTRYSGNAADLQLWVAACLFRFFLDQYRLLYGEIPPDALDDLVVSAAPLATGLNVKPETWPANWHAFEEYWDSMVPELSISEEVRRDFESLANLTFLNEAWGPFGRLLSRLFGRPYAFLTRGNLPPFFRTLMGWPWSELDQRRFERVLRLQRFADRLGNRRVIRLIYWLHVIDFRARVRLGLPVLGRLQVSERMVRDGGGRRYVKRQASVRH